MTVVVSSYSIYSYTNVLFIISLHFLVNLRELKGARRGEMVYDTIMDRGYHTTK